MTKQIGGRSEDLNFQEDTVCSIRKKRPRLKQVRHGGVEDG